LIDPGTVWTLMPLTPMWARPNRVLSIHSAEANESLTPRVPPQEIALTSSMRIGLPERCEVSTNGCSWVTKPLDAESASSSGIVITCEGVQCLSG
jgi:hypothetical protein